MVNTTLLLIVVFFLVVLFSFRLFAVADKYYILYCGQKKIRVTDDEVFYKKNGELDIFFNILAWIPVINAVVLIIIISGAIYHYFNWKNQVNKNKRDQYVLRIFGINFTKLWNKWTLRN